MKMIINSTQKWGVNYLDSSEKQIIEAPANDLYYYKVFVGEHNIDIERGDCLYHISIEKDLAHIRRGPCKVSSKYFAVLIRGYMPDERSVRFSHSTRLPYINGCSTKQLFAPVRLGDPTLQMLLMPPHTSEQTHHIHSTTRVVYVLSGSGQSIVGMPNATIQEPLTPGKIIILDGMCPHHFVTKEESLVVLPLHVFSSVGKNEFNHAMFNGTHNV